jgi:hypothetical protein
MTDAVSRYALRDRKPSDPRRAWHDFCDRMLEVERAQAEARRELERVRAEVSEMVRRALRAQESKSEPETVESR